MSARCLVVLLAASLALAEESTDLTSAQAEAFAWFDTLGYPDVAGKPYVQVWTGRWYQSGGNPPQNSCVWGFLLSEEGPKFTVFTVGLATEEFLRSDAEVKPQERVYYLKGDIEETARATVEDARNPPKEGTPEYADRLRAGDCVRLFCLARACAANGLTDLAGQLYDVAEGLVCASDDGAKAKDLRSAVSASIALGETWGWLLAFGDLQVPRSKLLQEFRRIEKAFPDSEHHGLVSETATLLDRMVKEDEEHAKSARPLGELTGKDRVAELLFQLRDQNGRQFSQPGECDIFQDERGAESPAAQLVAMGYEAVPQLIETIGDDRLTRSVGFWRNFSFEGHHVLRVGDCAKDVLERISGKTFYDRSSTSAYMSSEDQAKAVRKLAEEWWASVQAKGEDQVLIEAVEKGDRDAVEASRRLVERAPDRALSPLLAGLAKAKDGWTRGALLEVLARIPGDDSTRALREEAEKGPFLQSRVAAAWGLLPRAQEEAVDLMVREWRSGPRAERDDMYGSVEQLISFLAGCGRPEGVRALAADLGKREVSERMNVVEGVGGDSIWARMRGQGAPRPDGETAEAIRAAVDELLVEALEDTEQRMGMSGGLGTDSFSDPRICDFAAHFLAERWEGKVAFRLGGPESARDAAILQLKNLWRRDHGQEPLSPPEPTKIVVAPGEVVDPLIECVSKGEDAEAEAAIEALGISALAPVQAATARAGGGDGAERLGRLATRLASSVRVVDVDEEQGALPHSAREALRAMEGRPFTFEALRAVLLAVATEAETADVGVRLACRRPGDGTGVCVSASTRKERDIPETSSRCWSCDSNIVLGARRLGGCCSGSAWEYRQTERAYEDQRKPVEEALAAPVEEAWRITIELVPQR